MTIKQYQQQSYTNIQSHIDNKDEVLNWSIGLGEEVGEVFNHIKHFYWGKENIDKISISKEIGDVLWYLAALSTSLNLDLQTIAMINIKKLEHRYKNKFTDKQSQLRHLKDIEFTKTEEYKNLLKNLTYEKEQ